MAINIYGSCSGTSGNKYDIWLNVRQNSQSIENNTSNVSVSLFLKRNDGYSASAYNLSESANSATLTVNGEIKVSKNLVIDTRNGVSVNLASWTGDIPHSADGMLTFAVSGRFTMGGTHVSSGSVSGSFTCTDIPRKSTMTLSASTLNPGDTLTATIDCASSAFTHKIKYSFGSKYSTITIPAGESTGSFSFPVSWINQIPNARSGKMSAVLTTYKGSKNLGSNTYSVKIVIPSESQYMPDFTLITERIDNNVPADMNSYVQGVSQIKLDVDDLSLKYGAKKVSCVARVDTHSKNKVPATFSLVKSGEITLSVTIKDSRGFTTKKTKTITVCKYSVPSITINSIYRCNQSGEKTTSGSYIRVNYSTSVSSVNGKNTYKVVCKYKKAGTSTFSSETELEESPCVLPFNDFLKTNSYIVAFKITDEITKDTGFSQRVISSVSIPFNIKKGGKGAAFGCYSENSNELTVAWDLNVLGSVFYENIDIIASADVEDVRGIVRYIPCLEMVFVKLRFTAKNSLAGNTQHIIATIPKPPSLFTPINMSINTGTGAIPRGGIRSDTSELVLTADRAIDKGDYIYVSGVYMAYK